VGKEGVFHLKERLMNLWIILPSENISPRKGTHMAGDLE